MLQSSEKRTKQRTRRKLRVPLRSLPLILPRYLHLFSSLLLLLRHLLRRQSLPPIKRRNQRALQFICDRPSSSIPPSSFHSQNARIHLSGMRGNLARSSSTDTRTRSTGRKLRGYQKRFARNCRSGQVEDRRRRKRERKEVAKGKR